MQTWTFEVPVRFDQPGRLIPHADRGNWKHVFRTVPNLKDVVTNGAKRTEYDADFIFTLVIVDTSLIKAQERIYASLARGIKHRHFGTYTVIENGVRLCDEPEPVVKPTSNVPLRREEIDPKQLDTLDELLDFIARFHGLYFTGWSYELNASCGDVTLRLLRTPSNGQFIAIKRGDKEERLWLHQVLDQLEDAFQRVLEEPPAGSPL